VIDVVWENQRRAKVPSSPWGRAGSTGVGNIDHWAPEGVKGGRAAFESARPILVLLFAKHGGPPPPQQSGSGAAQGGLPSAGESVRNTHSISNNSGAGGSAGRLSDYMRRRSVLSVAAATGEVSAPSGVATVGAFSQSPHLANHDIATLPPGGAWRWLSPWQVRETPTI
jgi:hypothetical protein